MVSKLTVRSTLFGLLLLLASAVTFAGPIYDVNRTIGVGSVIGTIETDGTIGVLGIGNILDWTLTLDDGTGPFTLFGPLSGNNSALGIVGSSFTATVADILFDFSSVSGDWVLFQNPNLGSGINFWCLDDLSDGCSGNLGGETVTTFGPFANVFAGRTGVVSVATRGVSVPEPSTLALLGLGLVGMGLGRRRKKA